jgi:hypothetical protein
MDDTPQNQTLDRAGRQVSGLGAPDDGCLGYSWIKDGPIPRFCPIRPSESVLLFRESEGIPSGVEKPEIVFIQPAISLQLECSLHLLRNGRPIMQERAGAAVVSDVELQLSGRRQHPVDEAEERNEVRFAGPVGTDQDIERPGPKGVQPLDRLESSN